MSLLHVLGVLVFGSVSLFIGYIGGLILFIGVGLDG